MKIVKAKIKREFPVSPAAARVELRRMERAGRTCYKSERPQTDQTASEFAKMVLGRGHESVIEHLFASFRITTDRGVSHELVRHRLASYSQESTRYVNYRKRGGLEFIDPRVAFPSMSPVAFARWERSVSRAESDYLALESLGCPPELCRDVLPNSTRTEIVITANVREWRHFCQMRCDSPAHPQMREITIPILGQLFGLWPVLFADLWERFHPEGQNLSNIRNAKKVVGAKKGRR